MPDTPDTYTRDVLIEIARLTAHRYGLDPALVCAIIEQESDWMPWSIRYEPGFYQHYIAPMFQSGEIKTATEATARAMSWGLMQTMLQSVRELGYTDNAALLCTPSVGIDWGCRLFTHKLAAANGDVSKALSLWNGGGNQNYAPSVIGRMSKYKTFVTDIDLAT